MNFEVNALGKMDCWEIVDRPNSQKAMQSKLFLKRRENENGNVMRHARLTVRDYENLEYLWDSLFP